MPYIINKTNGQQLTIVQDASVDQTTDLIFVGRNYSGYGEIQNENFLKLQDELTSTENTIQTARTRYNEAIKPFNNHVKTFPNSILAGLFHFEGKPYFDAEAGAEKPVEVKF